MDCLSYRIIVLLFLLIGFQDRCLKAQDETYQTFPIAIDEIFDFGDGVITEIQEDWNGFIWIATTNGLFRFDGTEVKRYDTNTNPDIIPHSFVYSILVDHDEQVIWLGTRRGLARFDPASETSILYFSDPTDPSSLADDLVRKLIKDRDGNLWMSCVNRGLCLFDPEKERFTNYFFEYDRIGELHQLDPQINLSIINSITTFVQDAVNDHVFWLGTPFGLIRFNAQTAEFNWIDHPFSQVDEVTPESSIVEIYALEGRVVVGQSQGAYIYDIDTENITILNTGELARVTKIRQTKAGLQMSFRNGMMTVAMPEMKVIQRWIDHPELQQSHGILLVDSWDRSWIYSSSRLKLDQGFPQFVKGYLLPIGHRKNPSVTKRLTDDQIIQFTDEHKYYYTFSLSQKVWQVNSFFGEDLDESVQWQDFVRIDKTTSLLLTREELFYFNHRNGRLTKLELNLDLVRPRFRKLLLDYPKLWIGSLDHGLFQFDLETHKIEHYSLVFNTVNNSSAYTWINELFEDSKQRIWIRLGRSFAVYNKINQSFSHFPIEEHSNRTFRYIRNFAEDNRGSIWISSEDQGIGRVGEEIAEGIVQHLNVEDGLSSNNISQIAFSPAGRLWVLTDLGIDTFDPESGMLRKTSWNIGIPKSSHLLFLQEDQVAITWNLGGVAIFNVNLLQAEHKPPRPYLTNVRVRDQSVLSGTAVEGKDISFQTRRDYLSFEYSALGFINPKEFAYKLEGVDQDWVQTSQRRTVTYSNLKPGQYILLLKARNAGRHWSEDQQISFELLPQWWETLWFRGLILWLIGLITYLLYRWRLYTVRQRDRIKSDFQQRLNEVEMQALRSQMNPHFLFNSLNSIQHFIIKNQPKEAVDYLNRFSRLVRLILQHSRAKLVTLKEELDALRLYLDLENLRFKNKFSYEIVIDEDINQNDIEIPPMLIQPFVENAIWHGLLHKTEPGKITIKIMQRGEHLTCMVEDDGIGRAASGTIRAKSNQHRKSMGMSITQNRLDIINHEQRGRAAVDIKDLWYEDGRSKGTRVEITLPI